MSFLSILFDREPGSGPVPEAAAFFGDLHLDQILASLLEGREEYDLAPFFYRPLHEVEAVRYRHHVLGDLERPDVRSAIDSFAQEMHEMRDCLALMHKLRYGLQQQRWFLQSGAVYCKAIRALDEALAPLTLDSAGLLGLRNHLRDYVRSDAFTSLATETQQLTDELAAVVYAVHIKGTRVRVSRYEEQPDMSEEVECTFAKFKQGAVTDYRVGFREYADMNRIEAQILDLVARLHPEPFAHLGDFCARHAHYLDQTLERFDREVQFYLAYLDHIERLRSSGLSFSYPRVSARSKQEQVEEAFDLALATKLLADDATVVGNGFRLDGPERVLVVSGPNNGGKTTFARLFGQLHYLASLGLPVPGRDARLFLPDQIFTHFEREEDVETLRGKFEDELYRIHEILARASGSSVLIMNESFGSTTLRDALRVGTEVMRQIIDLDALCVFVTFVDELASLSESTVSMMSTVVPDDPAVRTYRVIRKPADGLAYAAAIAEKYGLTYERLRRRIAQ